MIILSIFVKCIVYTTDYNMFYQIIKIFVRLFFVQVEKKSLCYFMRAKKNRRSQSLEEAEIALANIEIKLRL